MGTTQKYHFFFDAAPNLMSRTFCLTHRHDSVEADHERYEVEWEHDLLLIKQIYLKILDDKTQMGR